MSRTFPSWPLLLVEAARRSAPGSLRAAIRRCLPTTVSRRIKRLRQSAPPPHRDPHPLPPHSDNVSQRVARMLGGPAARAVRSGTVGKGKKNDGIILHRVEGSRHPAPEFVEKITIGQAEAMLLHCIRKAHFPAGDLVPAIYGVTRDARRYHIFMERLRNFGPPPEGARGPELADALARSILRFGQAVQDLLDAGNCTVPMRRAPRRGEDHRLRALVTATGEASLAVLLAEVEEALSERELVASHNDLHWENISLEWRDDGPALRFIDFNCLGLNHPGADLHFFAAEARRNPGAAAFFARLSATCAGLSGLPAQLLRTAACFEAAHYESRRELTATAQTRAEAVALLREAHRQL